MTLLDLLLPIALAISVTVLVGVLLVLTDTNKDC